MLSFGKNCVRDHNAALTYLRKLKNNLEVLKMAENPFVKTSGQNPDDYKLLAIEWIKGLKYLDYELIEEDTREKANEKHKEDINENESKNNAEKKNDE